MASSSRRAVVTGIGLLTPVGLTHDAIWQALQSGQSGVRTLHGYDTSALPVHFAGEIVGFDAKKYLDKDSRKSLKVMARTIQLAVAAAHLALNDSGVDKAQLDPTRFGCEFGSGLIATELEELGSAAQVSSNCQPGTVDLERWGTKGLEQMPPLWMLKYLPNMLACHVSILHNAQGPNNTVTESDVASVLALGEAFRIIGRDQADFFLVGGADSRLSPLSLVRQCLFQPLSKRNDAPEKASRPFDKQRDGLVVGEGAGVLTLEELGHAQNRGARIYGEVVGFGAAFDRKHTGDGIARAIRVALKEAGIGPDDIDHINAHGISTVEGDIWEARGLQAVFGQCAQPVPVFAFKSYVGNLGAGGGLAELSISLLAQQRGSVPPTLNYEEPDSNCILPVLTGNSRPVEKPCFIKVSATDLGQCAAVVIRKWKE